MVFAEGETTVTLTALEGTGGDGDEGYPRLVDGKKSSDNFSKWCMSLPTDGAYIVVSVPDAIKVTGYTLTTGNDNSKYPGRNPSGWVLYGCNDYTGAGSGSWVAIDTKANDTDMKDVDYTDYSFEVSGAGYYKYYKLHITAVKNDNIMQLAEMAFSTCIHSWSAETTVSEATCTEPKYVKKTYNTADGCGMTLTYAVGNGLGHDTTSDTCSRCGKNVKNTAGVFSVIGAVSGEDFTYENGTLTVLISTPITIKNEDPSVVTSDHIVVRKDISANITLAGVNISTSSAPAFKIEDNSAGNVTVTLAANSVNTLISTGSNYAGLQKNGGSGSGLLTLAGTGKLTAQGGSGGAGIGGGNGGSGSNISISGGTVTAKGGNLGAGIGGGSEGSGSNISISGGTVTATGGNYAAGIGGGYSSSGSNITISGSSVHATKGIYANDIGGGNAGNGSVTPKNSDNEDVFLLMIRNPNTSKVYIDGVEYKPSNHAAAGSNDTNLYAYVTGTEHTVVIGNRECPYIFADGTFISTAPEFDIKVTKTGAEAVLGTDYYYDKGVLSIVSDKDVTVSNKSDVEIASHSILIPKDTSVSVTLDGVNINTSSAPAFKIEDGSRGNVTVTLAANSENTLTSTGEDYAGLQKNGSIDRIGKLTITGTGKLTAQGGKNGAGIGGGYTSSGSNITIYGGTVTATGGGVGNGGGYGAFNSNITISGGIVTATGNGAGIGGGYNPSITISGGTITATGGGVGIGGIADNYGSNITISGGIVTAKGGRGGAGIGGGSGSNITISGGIVTAKGGSGGAGIGGGSGSNITISGGSVRAFKGKDAPNDIGGKDGNDPVIPKNSDNEDVFLLTIPNPNTAKVYIDGAEYNPSNHTMADPYDINLYAYVTGTEHTVVIGDKECSYTFANGTFTSTMSEDAKPQFDIKVTETGAEAVLGTDYYYDEGVLSIVSDKDVTVSNKSDVETASHSILIPKDTSVSVTLDGVNISTSSAPAFKIEDDSTGDVTVTLAANSINTLTSIGYNYAGLQKNGGTETGTLIITGTGKLTAQGGRYGAGIGGGSDESGSNITIIGGAVTATGGNCGAGIGGGNDGTGSNIKITGGIVTAQGGDGEEIPIAKRKFFPGVGIGGGGAEYDTNANTLVSAGSGSNIIISGGSVLASAGVPANAADPHYDIGGSNSAVTPKNENNEDVYLLNIDNPNSEVIMIDGKVYPPNHSAINPDDKVLHAYVTRKNHEISFGKVQYTYTFNSTDNSFTKSASPSIADISTKWELDITATKNGEDLVFGKDYSYGCGILSILTDKGITIKNKAASTATTDHIFVGKDITANITLNGVNISTPFAPAFKIEDNSTGNVTVTLAENSVNTLTSTADGYAGLQKNGDGADIGKLTITGTGKLTANGGRGGAGIGGGNGSGSNIMISGGTVSAQGGYYGAGIGGGWSGNGSNITISGGSVHAVKGENANDIGGGIGKSAVIPKNSDNEDVFLLTIPNPNTAKVYIDEVEYKPSNHAAAGYDINLYAYVTGTEHTVVIGDKERSYTFADGIFTSDTPEDTNPQFDIKVTETGAEAVLGTDYYYVDGVLSIVSDKDVTVSNKSDFEMASHNILIPKDTSVSVTLDGVNINTSSAPAFKIEDDSTGDVTVTLAANSENNLTSLGDDYAGLQKNGGSGLLTITGTGKLTAQGGKNGAGIGGGNNGTASNITISGGTVTAIGNSKGAGIGGGNNGTTSNITISGGTVTAKGGSCGAGIGGGMGDGKGDCLSSNITISGGTVTATGGQSGGAGIGGGYYASGSTITISGGTVTAKGGSYGAGIGGGVSRSGSNITISGGSVHAIKGNDAPNDIGGGYLGNGAVTPTNGTSNVYLMTIPNSSNAKVYIDNVEYTPSNHSAIDKDDTNLYTYVTGAHHTVKVGDETSCYHFANNVLVKCNYDDSWTNDTNGHWHACSDNNCDIQHDFAEHTFDREVADEKFEVANTVATCKQGKQYYKSCICGTKGEETFYGTYVDSSNHEGTLGDWQITDSEHWKEYSCCNAKANEGTHKDENPSDHKCDDCGKVLSVCEDKDFDHFCDYTDCKKKTSECEDVNEDHFCDYDGCKKELSKCADENNDHFCDYDGCKKELSKCVDENNDHFCDYSGCKLETSECEDANNDHYCDYAGCKKKTSECEDANEDHFCDYDGCKKELSKCADTNNDHICDYAGCKKELSKCVDENNDHICDYAGCKKELSKCVDENKDHLCDYAGCKKKVSKCTDENKDHICDYAGCKKELSKCTDENKDHYCDCCDKVLSDHNMKHHDATEPECAVNGNTEYYECEFCGKYYSDADGKNEITLESTVIPATGHSYDWGECTECGSEDPNASFFIRLIRYIINWFRSFMKKL